MAAFRLIIRDDHGQGLAEYGLILGLVSVVAFAALTTLGTNVTAVIQSAASNI